MSLSKREFLQARGARFMRRRLLLAGVGALLPSVARASPLALGDAVPWPKLTLLNGDVLQPRQWQGQAAVLVFFATTCPFCRRHNEHVEKLHQAARGLPLRVLAVAQDGDAELVRAYVREHRYHFPVTMDSAALRPLFSQRQIIPLTCVVDRAGKLRELLPGEMFEEDLLELTRWAKAG